MKWSAAAVVTATLALAGRGFTKEVRSVLSHIDLGRTGAVLDAGEIAQGHIHMPPPDVYAERATGVPTEL